MWVCGRRMKTLPMLIRSFVSLLVCAWALWAQAPDLIVHNAKVVTVDAQFRIAQAIAVAGDRLVAVGSNAEVLGKKGPNTRVIDAGGKTVLPGLMDSHVHATSASMYEFDHEIPAHGDDCRCSALLQVADSGSAQGGMDPAVAGVHHAAARATLSDARRVGFGGPGSPRDLRDRTRRVVEHDGVAEVRNHEGHTAAARPAWQDRTGSKDRRADGHSSQRIAVRQGSVEGWNSGSHVCMANYKSSLNRVVLGADSIAGMRDFLILFVHLIATLARLARPGGLRSVVAESVLVRHQLLVLNRGRKRAPNLRGADRLIAGLCTFFGFIAKIGIEGARRQFRLLCRSKVRRRCRTTCQ